MTIIITTIIIYIIFNTLLAGSTSVTPTALTFAVETVAMVVAVRYLQSKLFLEGKKTR